MTTGIIFVISFVLGVFVGGICVAVDYKWLQAQAENGRLT